jgi:26S proteasome regulatory subunit N12
LFLDSEGAVVNFAKERGWSIRDGRIYFPSVAEDGEETGGKDALVASGTIIENTIGYARDLETIV